MEQLYKSKTVLLIGNDPSNQNPLVGWQIRAGIRHYDTKLFAINAQEIKLERKATQFVKVGEGKEAAAVRWLLNGEGNFGVGVAQQLGALRSALESESDVAIVFGSEITGAAIAQLVEFGSKL